VLFLPVRRGAENRYAAKVGPWKAAGESWPEGENCIARHEVGTGPLILAVLSVAFSLYDLSRMIVPVNRAQQIMAEIGNKQRAQTEARPNKAGGTSIKLKAKEYERELAKLHY
jgi:hypothetical protein